MVRNVCITVFLVFLCCLSQSLFSAQVSLETAQRAAQIQWEQKAPVSLKDLSSYLVLQEVFTNQDDTLLFVFGYPGAGFLLISGDDRAMPVPAMSFESSYNPESKNLSFSSWLNYLLHELRAASAEDYIADASAVLAWKQLMSGQTIVSRSQDIPALLLTRWDQGMYYNALCPEDPDGPGGRVYAGCVATMMAQVINHHKFPLTGIGQKGYSSSYGYLSVNFANSNYDYHNMPVQLTSHNQAVAKLIYDCGVAVSMNYSPNGSGAYMNNARDAMVQNFGYSALTALEAKNSYQPNDWIDKLLIELSAGRPVMYAGYPSSGSGHAFVLDGYQQGDFFHFNWGWSGSYDGYFLLSALTPGGSNFSNWQTAIMQAYPAGNYPYFCSGDKTITGTKGVVFDGSGTQNYANNSDCNWLLEPNELVTSVTLNFLRFETEDVNDYLIIYHGADTNSPIVAVLSGDSLPQPITVTNDKALIRFISNSSVGKAGFDISFSWALQVFCTGTQILTDHMGSFSDGSGTNSYRGGSMCKWLIEPPGAQSITLGFNAFQTETGVDLVRIYDPSTVPSTLLATYSGFAIPPPVTSNSGKMLLIFQTNQNVNALGWDAYYNSTPLGVSINHDAGTKIRVFPVPAKDEVFVDISIEEKQPVIFRIYDCYGRFMAVLKPEQVSGISVHKLSISGFSSGIYFLYAEIGGDVLVQKLVIAH